MEKDQIHFGDLKRWLFGTMPPEFMIEVFIRTILIYLILLIMVRLMGKRMSGQITITEMAVMITLGAIVSPAMQLPDRGLFLGVLGLVCALLFQRGYNYFGVINKKAEDITQGTASLLIKDGKLNLKELEKASLPKQQLYAMLREKKINNLGAVKRAYFESCGMLSVYPEKEKKPGLPILPQRDPHVVKGMKMRLDSTLKACCNCGCVQQITNEHTACDVCQEHAWGDAYIPD